MEQRGVHKGGFWGSSASIRSFSDTTISPSTIWGGHGAFLKLDFGGTNIYVYAVQIKYY